MIINNVYIGKDKAPVSIQCDNNLLKKIVRPIWGPETVEQAMRAVANAIQFNLLYHANGKLVDKDWVTGWLRSEKVYSRYDAANNLFEIFRVGDIVA